MSVDACEFVKEAYTCSIAEVILHYTSEKARMQMVEFQDYKGNLASVVRFTGELLQGSSVLMAKQADLERMLEDMPPDNAMDWLGELNNQVVGRLQNKLARYNTPVMLGTPTNNTFSRLDIGAARMGAVGCRGDWSSGTLHGMLAVRVAPGLVLSATSSRSIGGEGKLELF